MSASQTGKKIESLIDNAVESFSDGVKASQNNAYSKILGLLTSLDIKDGVVSRTVKNIKTVRSINRLIDNAILTDIYKTRVNNYINTFNVVESVNAKYFTEAFNKFNQDKTIYSLIKEESILTTRNQLLESGINANFTEPIKEILDRNVKGGALYGDLLEEVRIFVKGNAELDGALLRYSKQVTSDSLHVYSGVYNKAVGDDLGLKWYLYSGGLIDTTRSFCQQRAGKYWHESEIKDWSSLRWQGKARGTSSSSIFHYVGGYNCRHTLIPVDEAAVPSSDIKRIAA